MQMIRRFFWPLVVIGMVVLLVLTYEIGRQSVYQAYPELTQAEQASAVIAQVGKLIQLPRGETPAMASIKDAASAKRAEPFLTNAQNGDILIVYSTVGEAILYRPSIDKLIGVGPVDTTAPQPAAPIQSATTTKSKK